MIKFVRKSTKQSLLTMLRKADKITPRLLARLFEGVLFKDEYETFSAAGGIDHGNLGGLTDDDHVRYVDIDGTRELTADWDAGPHEIRAETLESDVATGTAPLTVASETMVDNLNADLLDGYDEADFDYTLISGNDSDTDVTGLELEELTDGSDTTLHEHPYDYDDISGNDADTDVTGAELEELTDGSTTALHKHTVNAQTVCLSTYTDLKARNLGYNIHGHLHLLDTAHDLGAGDLVVTAGISKILLVINAGADVAGDITVTGTVVDRNTGAETAAQTDTITIDAVTTDGSDTDASSNVRHSLTGAYITSRWFKGSITISSADTDVTDMDTYQVAFEQCNDSPASSISSFDISAHANNANAWLYAYLYILDVTGDKCNVSRIADIDLPAAEVSADTHYRLRRGNLAGDFDGTTDGLWFDLFLGPLASAYWEDINTKVWVGISSGETTEEFAKQCWNAEDLTIGVAALANASADTPDDGSESVQLSSYSTMVAISGSPARDLTQCWQADSGGGIGSTDVYMYLGETKGFVPSEGLTMRVEAVIWDDGAGAFGRVGLLSESGTNGIRAELNGTTLDIDTASGAWTQKVSTASGLSSAPSGACWYVLSMEYDFSDNGYVVRVIELGGAGATQEDVSISGTVSSPTFDADTRLTKVFAQSGKTTQEVTERNGIAQLWVGDDSDAFPLGYKQTSNFTP